MENRQTTVKELVHTERPSFAPEQRGKGHTPPQFYAHPKVEDTPSVFHVAYLNDNHRDNACLSSLLNISNKDELNSSNQEKEENPPASTTDHENVKNEHDLIDANDDNVEIAVLGMGIRCGDNNHEIMHNNIAAVEGDSKLTGN